MAKEGESQEASEEPRYEVKVGVILAVALVLAVVIGTFLAAIAHYLARWLGLSEVALTVACVGVLAVGGVVLSFVTFTEDLLVVIRLALLELIAKEPTRVNDKDSAAGQEGRDGRDSQRRGARERKLRR